MIICCPTILSYSKKTASSVFAFWWRVWGESWALIENSFFQIPNYTFSKSAHLLLPWISKAFSSGWFNLKPKTNLCIESSQRQNSGYRSRATRVHPKSQSGLNQRNYPSLRESLHWLESTSVWVGLHCVTRAPLLYFTRSWVALSFKVYESVSQWVRHR